MNESNQHRGISSKQAKQYIQMVFVLIGWVCIYFSPSVYHFSAFSFTRIRHAPCPIGSIWIVQLMSSHWPFCLLVYVWVCDPVTWTTMAVCSVHRILNDRLGGKLWYADEVRSNGQLCDVLFCLLFRSMCDHCLQFRSNGHTFKVFFCRRKTYLKCIIKLDYITSGCKSFLLNKARKNAHTHPDFHCLADGIYFLSSDLYTVWILVYITMQSSSVKWCSYVSSGSIRKSS